MSTTKQVFNPLSGQFDIVTATIAAATDITGQVPIANGGTGQASASAAFDALAPSQTGNSGKFLTTNGSTTSWGTAGGSSSTPIVTKTTTYTLQNTDRIIYVDTSAGAWTLTIPTAGSGNQDIIYRIRKTNNDFNILTLSGGLSTTVNTINEEIEIINNGTTWSILSRNGISGVLLSTSTQTIKGISSDPTKGLATIDTCFRWRVGSKLYTQYSFAWSTAGSAGSGNYYFPPPSGITVDTAGVSTNFTTNNGTGTVGHGRIATTNDGTKGIGVSLDTSGRAMFVGNESGNIISPSFGNLAQDAGNWSAVWYVPVSGWNDV